MSFRSKRYINVASLAKTFNGGGHIRAAGGHYNGNYDELLDALVSASKKAFENERVSIS